MNASGVGWVPTNSANLYGGGDSGVCSCVGVCVLVHACACVMCLQYTIIIFDQG